MRKLFLALLTTFVVPVPAFAQSAAPELFGVREVIVQYVKFSDAKVADACGLTREAIEEDIRKSLSTSTVPFVFVEDAKPPSLGIARISLVPEITSREDDNLGCTSFVSLSAESRANVIVSPVQTLRTETIVYWHQKNMIASSQSTHQKAVDSTMQKMAMLFAEQYKLDQPPEFEK